MDDSGQGVCQRHTQQPILRARNKQRSSSTSSVVDVTAITAHAGTAQSVQSSVTPRMALPEISSEGHDSQPSVSKNTST